MNECDLISHIYANWLNWICTLDKTKYEIIWFININPINGKKFQSYIDTFNRLVGNRVNVIFMKFEKKWLFLYEYKKIMKLVAVRHYII